MTYQEAATLKSNAPFTDRVRVAVSSWQDYLINTADADPEHDIKVAEGGRISATFDNEVTKVLNALIGDSEILALQSGATVPDGTLQLIVEKYVKALSPANTAPPATMMMAAPGQAAQTKWEAPKFLREERKQK